MPNYLTRIFQRQAGRYNGDRSLETLFEAEWTVNDRAAVTAIAWSVPWRNGQRSFRSARKNLSRDFLVRTGLRWHNIGAMRHWDSLPLRSN